MKIRWSSLQKKETSEIRCLQKQRYIRADKQVEKPTMERDTVY